jgi:hypothetical protein
VGAVIPLGFTPHFSTDEVVVIVVLVVGFGLLTALPASATLAAIGHRRAGQHPGWNAFWYWLWGTALTLGSMITFLYLDLSWWSIPLSWPLPLALAWLLKPRTPRPGSELGWGDMTTGQGER